MFENESIFVHPVIDTWFTDLVVEHEVISDSVLRTRKDRLLFGFSEGWRMDYFVRKKRTWYFCC